MLGLSMLVILLLLKGSSVSSGECPIPRLDGPDNFSINRRITVFQCYIHDYTALSDVTVVFELDGITESEDGFPENAVVTSSRPGFSICAINNISWEQNGTIVQCKVLCNGGHFSYASNEIMIQLLDHFLSTTVAIITESHRVSYETTTGSISDPSEGTSNIKLRMVPKLVDIILPIVAVLILVVMMMILVILVWNVIVWVVIHVISEQAKYQWEAKTKRYDPEGSIKIREARQEILANQKHSDQDVFHPHGTSEDKGLFKTEYCNTNARRRTFPISDTDRTKAKYSTIPVDAEALVSTITPFQNKENFDEPPLEVVVSTLENESYDVAAKTCLPNHISLIPEPSTKKPTDIEKFVYLQPEVSAVFKKRWSK